MGKKLKVLVLFNSEGRPPEDQDYSKWLEDENNPDWAAERHVVRSLKVLGHEAKLLGIFDDIGLMVDTVKKDKPDVVFNLVENFQGISVLDANVAATLEAMEAPFTGCGSAGLFLCRNKALCKKVLAYHRIKAPLFWAFARGKRIWHPRRLKYPAIVKPLREDGSVAIAQDSIVDNDKSFCERVEYIHKSLKADAIAEEYVDGREFYVSVLGNERLQVFPVREMKFGEVPENAPHVATYKAKWDDEYRQKWKITNVFAGRMPDGVQQKIEKICKRAYRILMLRGYGRFDLRLEKDGEVFLIEANPNPWLASNDEVAQSAEKTGLTYDMLIQRILNLALRRA